MTRYEYKDEMMDAIRDYIRDEIDADEYRGNRDELEARLNDDLWIDDSVTGNASGSYYCNAYKAREAIGGALDTLVEALEEFGDEPESYKRALMSPEYADVTIRCYLLGECIAEVLDEMEERGDLDEIEDEDEDENADE